MHDKLCCLPDLVCTPLYVGLKNQEWAKTARKTCTHFLVADLQRQRGAHEARQGQCELAALTEILQELFPMDISALMYSPRLPSLPAVESQDHQVSATVDAFGCPMCANIAVVYS